ncbi:MAG: hypothetical protein ACAI25_03055 [Planctomycetota bacterium]
MTTPGAWKRRLLLGALALAVLVPGALALVEWRGSSRVPTRHLPALGGLVTIPVTTATESVLQATIELPSNGAAVLLVATDSAPWAGLQLPRDIPAAATGPADPLRHDRRIVVARGASDSWTFTLGGKLVATKEASTPISDLAGVLRRDLAAPLKSTRSLTIDADAAAPFELVALLTAIAAERAVFCDFASIKTPPATPELTRAIGGITSARAEAVRLRAAASVPWGLVASVLNAVAEARLWRFTFVVDGGGVEHDLVSTATAPPPMITFPDALHDDTDAGPR